MAGINIMVDQAYKDIEAMIESLENSVEEERTKQRLDAIESEWWSYPGELRKKFPDHIQQWFENRRRKITNP